jgi:hypothetical protein
MTPPMLALAKAKARVFHPESLKLDTKREVKELLNDASNEGSDVQGADIVGTDLGQCSAFRAKFTIPQSWKPIHQGEVAKIICNSSLLPREAHHGTTPGCSSPCS